jgi:hypothetical protein
MINLIAVEEDRFHYPIFWPIPRTYPSPPSVNRQPGFAGRPVETRATGGRLRVVESPCHGPSEPRIDLVHSLDAAARVRTPLSADFSSALGLCGLWQQLLFRFVWPDDRDEEGLGDFDCDSIGDRHS